MSQSNLCCEHQKEITLFCTSRNCLLGMCVDCVVAHQGYHQRHHDYAQLDTIDSLVLNCSQDLMVIQNNYLQSLQQTNYLKDQTLLQDFVIDQKINTIQNAMQLQLNQYFSQLRAQSHQLQQEQHNTFMEKLDLTASKIGNKIEETDKINMKLTQGKNKAKQISYLFTSNLCLNLEKERTRTDNYLNEIQDNLLDIRQMPLLEDKMNTLMKENIKLELVNDIRKDNNDYDIRTANKEIIEKNPQKINHYLQQKHMNQNQYNISQQQENHKIELEQQQQVYQMQLEQQKHNQQSQQWKQRTPLEQQQTINQQQMQQSRIVQDQTVNKINIFSNSQEKQNIRKEGKQVYRIDKEMRQEDSMQVNNKYNQPFSHSKNPSRPQYIKHQ